MTLGCCPYTFRVPLSFPRRGSHSARPVVLALSPSLPLRAADWTPSFSATWIYPLVAVHPITGNGKIQYVVSSNNGAARNATITVAGQTYNVTQAGYSCAYNFGPNYITPGSAGGNYNISVAPSSANCSWTASSNVPWVTVKSGASVIGDGVVVLDVAANTGGVRSGTATVANQTVSVYQAAAGSQLPTACGASDVTSQVSVSRGGLTQGQSCDCYNENITVTNNSGSAISGPIFMAFLGVPNHEPSPYGTSLNGALLTTCFSAQGDSLLLISGGLSRGQSIPFSVTFFADSLQASVGYTYKVLSGTPSH